MGETESIKEYFRGKNVFITGGSGFIGKCLIEKLLRTCSNIGHIYVLIRPKKGKSGIDRIQQIFASPIFDTLKEQNPQAFEKVIPIEGDAAEPGLGISNENRALLIKEINLFYHVAASVKFDDFLKDAIFINIRSAREAALLSLEMEKIEVFMHVSTTYCNIDNRKEVHEILYPPHGDWKQVIDIAEKADTHTINILSQKFIDEFPNTYTYTKQLAEHCINELLVGKVPTVICRPSVVVSTLTDPIQGWVDNLNGPVGLLLAGGVGLLRIVYGDKKVNMDYMCVDSVVKLMIVTSWHKAIHGDINAISIYQASKYKDVDMKQKALVDMGASLYWDVPFEKKIWFPVNSMTSCWYYYYINVILFHLIPAVFIDLILRVAGHRPFIFKVQRKIYIGNMAVSHFMLNEWNFVNTNSVTMFENIPRKEVEEFNFKSIPDGPQAIYQYYLTSCEHARRYLLKEGPTIKPETRVRTRRMYYLDRAIKLLFFSYLAWTLLFKINIFFVIYKVLYNYFSNL